MPYSADRQNAFSHDFPAGDRVSGISLLVTDMRGFHGAAGTMAIAAGGREPNSFLSLMRNLVAHLNHNPSRYRSQHGQYNLAGGDKAYIADIPAADMKAVALEALSFLVEERALSETSARAAQAALDRHYPQPSSNQSRRNPYTPSHRRL